MRTYFFYLERSDLTGLPSRPNREIINTGIPLRHPRVPKWALSFEYTRL